MCQHIKCNLSIMLSLQGNIIYIMRIIKKIIVENVENELCSKKCVLVSKKNVFFQQIGYQYITSNIYQCFTVNKMT